MQNDRRYDVAILGTGMSGTILGAILARQGIDVVMIDSQPHPRFAVGESTIPHTSLLLSILAERYDMPEIDYLAYPDRIAKHVCTTCGIKRSFGFAYQRPGKLYDHREGIQFGTSSKDENHLFRQDIDAYLLHVAIRKGARALLDERVSQLSIDAAGVTIETDRKRTIRARYVVDGTGHRSCLAEKFGLREQPSPLKHHSRSLFTHMVDVAEFEQDKNPLSLPWKQTTLHHCFDGGWFWVIPFNNHELSRNPLISVGLTIDCRRWPKGAADPEDEFQDWLERFPSVREQFKDARAVRPWVSTGRLQFSSSASSGYRYCLMSHASGFIDPLYSRGLINTIENISALLEPLLAALASDDFAEEPFRQVDRLQKRLLSYNDRVVHYSFVAWRSFELWNAWARIWALGTIITEFRLIRTLAEYSRTQDVRALEGEARNPAFSDQEDPDYGALFERACEIMTRLEAGALDDTQAAALLWSAMGDYEFPVALTLDGMRRAGWVKEESEVSERNLEAARKGFRWALSNPGSRDLFGSTKTFYRWRARHDDPHLA